MEDGEKDTLTAEDEAAAASFQYFLSIGCRGCENVGSGFRPYLIRLPNAREEWGMAVCGDVLVVERYAEPRYRHGKNSARYTKLFKVLLADPDSFPKVLAHMQKHSTFLRGGTNQLRHIPKAD